MQLRNGQVGYPILQFDSRTVLGGIPQVVTTLSPVVATSWTIASWLTSPQPTLDGQRPVDLLRDGDIGTVAAAARRFAAAMAA